MKIQQVTRKIKALSHKDCFYLELSPGQVLMVAHHEPTVIRGYDIEELYTLLEHYSPCSVTTHYAGEQLTITL